VLLTAHLTRAVEPDAGRGAPHQLRDSASSESVGGGILLRGSPVRDHGHRAQLVLVEYAASVRHVVGPAQPDVHDHIHGSIVTHP
jgi:hypothetical protein